MHSLGSYIWNFISKFGAQVLWLVTNMVLARYLAPSEFGKVGVLSLVFMVANTLSEAGLGGALIIQKTIKKEDCSTIFTFNMAISLFLYVLILGFSGFIENFYNVQGLAKITRILSMVFVINALACVPRTILCYRLQFKELCIITLVSVIISSVVSIVLAVYNYGVYALVAYQIILAFLQFVGVCIVSKYQFSIAFHWQSFKSLFSFGFFTTVCGVVDTVYENLLAAIYGKGLNMTQAGYLSQAKRIEDASTQALLSSVNNTAFPILAKFKDDIHGFHQESTTILKVIPLFVFPVLVVLMVFSKEVILLLFGEQWLEAAHYLSLLLVAGMFMVLDSITRNFIKSLGKVKDLLNATIIKRTIAIIIVLICAFVSLDLILYGYILGSIVGLFINLIAYHRVSSRKFGAILYDSVRSFALIIPLWIIIYLCYHVFRSLFAKIISSFIVLILFYLVIVKTNLKYLSRTQRKS